MEKICWHGIGYSGMIVFGIEALCSVFPITYKLIINTPPFLFVGGCFVIGFGISIYKHRRK